MGRDKALALHLERASRPRGPSRPATIQAGELSTQPTNQVAAHLLAAREKPCSPAANLTDRGLDYAGPGDTAPRPGCEGE